MARVDGEGLNRALECSKVLVYCAIEGVELLFRKRFSFSSTT